MKGHSHSRNFNYQPLKRLPPPFSWKAKCINFRMPQKSKLRDYLNVNFNIQHSQPTPLESPSQHPPQRSNSAPFTTISLPQEPNLAAPTNTNLISGISPPSSSTLCHPHHNHPPTTRKSSAKENYQPSSKTSSPVLYGPTSHVPATPPNVSFST